MKRVLTHFSLQTAGAKVLLCDNNPAQLKSGVDFMHNLLAKELKKGKIGAEEMEQVKKRIGTVEGISGFGGEDGVDLAIEVLRSSLAQQMENRLI